VSEQSPSGVAFYGHKDVFIVDQRRLLAAGPTSMVWLGTDSSGNWVCIKTFQPTGVHRAELIRFLTEIVSRQALDHPNILPILDHGYTSSADEESDPFIALPYCEGGSLRDLLHGRDFIGPDIFLPILEQIAVAVDFAHANGVIHGDIKPENILFRGAERVQACLTDFGIATFFPVLEAVTPGDVDMALGSTAYLSPEQIMENRQTPLSDIYSLALVAYEAMTGTLPFDPLAPAFQQMTAKVEGEIIDPRTVHRLIESICIGLLAGLSVRPQDRPRSGKELCQLLRGEKTVPDTPTRPVDRSRTPAAQRKYLIKLSQILSERFDEGELRSLCFHLDGVDYDSLPGEGKASKARELINYLARRNRILELVEIGKRLRPDIPWQNADQQSRLQEIQIKNAELTFLISTCDMTADHSRHSIQSCVTAHRRHSI